MSAFEWEKSCFEGVIFFNDQKTFHQQKVNKESLYLKAEQKKRIREAVIVLLETFRMRTIYFCSCL